MSDEAKRLLQLAVRDLRVVRDTNLVENLRLCEVADSHFRERCTKELERPPHPRSVGLSRADPKINVEGRANMAVGRQRVGTDHEVLNVLVA